ncbi:MAG: glycosyltransferase family 39 protein [bacterium]|nr:glycosyltransferase family 39 protein [bacterium]
MKLKIFALLTLAAVVLLALFLRVYNLDSAPRGVLADEASQGYNAYSILKTGKDEWAKPFPILFKAFGDQKLPVYTYSTVPFVAVLGLNNYAIRLPSAIAGTIWVLLLFFLLIELKFSNKAALLTSLIAATAPWSLILSRYSYESNVALLLFTLGIFTLLKAVKINKTSLYILSGLIFGFTWYTYVAYRLNTVLFVIPLVAYLVLRKQIIAKQAGIFFIAFVITILPLLPQVLSREGTARLTQVQEVSKIGTVMEINEKRSYCTRELSPTLCYLFWNKGTVTARALAEKYMTIFSFEYLFIKGDEKLPYLQVQGVGQLLITTFPLLLLGFAFLWKVKQKSELLTPILIIGLLTAPIPAILTSEVQKVRGSALLLFLLVLIALGVQYLSTLKKLSHILLSIITVAVIAEGTMFYINYLTVHLKKYDSYVNEHIPQVMDYLLKEGKNKQVVIKPFFSDPIIFYAYHGKVDPEHYQKNIKWDSIQASGFQHAKSLYNITVSDRRADELACNDQVTGKATLFVTDERLNNTAALLTVRSANGIDNIAYIYDIKDVKAPDQCALAVEL